MGLCSRCGNSVSFRYVNGRCVPIHNSGGCIRSSADRVKDYSGYQSCESSLCFSTNCPKCAERVFFLRHNGGSVWLDPPLGWPWYKHGCFESQRSLTDDYQGDMVAVSGWGAEHESQELGVVTRTYVEKHKNYTDLIFETGDSGANELQIKNNAGFLLGKLCVFDHANQEIWPFFEPDYRFIAYDAEKHGYVIPPPVERSQWRPGFAKKRNVSYVKCSICGCKLNPSRKRRHMRKVHGIKLSKSQSKAF